MTSAKCIPKQDFPQEVLLQNINPFYLLAVPLFRAGDIGTNLNYIVLKIGEVVFQIR